MKLNKLFLIGMGLSAVVLTGCKDDWTELNQDPAAVVTPNASQLFAQAVNVFEPVGYLEYYYNAPMKYAWSGMGISSSGASEGITTVTAHGDQGGQSIKVLRFVRDIENALGTMSEADKASNEAYLAAAKVLTIYCGIFDTDLSGPIPYTQACWAKYKPTFEDGTSTMTPAYDQVEDLYTLWLAELEECMGMFTKSTATMNSQQDVVFKGDCAKWAKFANSLRLRLAARLVNQDMNRAKQIAEAVVSAPCGYISAEDLSEDVLFNKAADNTNGTLQDYSYHWSNGFSGCSATKTVAEFMVKNRDPRVRFFYTKNSWNSAIVNEYLKQGLELPPFIEENVEKTEDGKGFKAWKNGGEPWVRYYGVTEEFMAQNNLNQGANKWYWPSLYGNAATETTIYNDDKTQYSTYTAFSSLNQQMIIGRGYDSNGYLHKLPGDDYTFSCQPRPWFGMYLGAGEVNLYLAEFKLHGANLPKSANEYFTAGLTASVKEADKLAELNQAAYYSKDVTPGLFGYAPVKDEGETKLVAGEIETMLSNADYQLTGNVKADLEKVFIQEMLHFTLTPNEVYVTARRSGYPSYNSTLLQRANYGNKIQAIPRRWATGAILPTDLMAEKRTEAYQKAGLTVTADGRYDAQLATERLWMDKNAPEWGAGWNK